MRYTSFITSGLPVIQEFPSRFTQADFSGLKGPTLRLLSAYAIFALALESSEGTR
jgi:hypothetical protein